MHLYAPMSTHAYMWRETSSHLMCLLQGVMHIQVVALVTQPEHVRSDESNTFHFVFSTALDEEGAARDKGGGSQYTPICT